LDARRDAKLLPSSSTEKSFETISGPGAGDWTLFVSGKLDRQELADCMENSILAQCDLLENVWEKMGVYESKTYDIKFPYFRNKEQK